MRSQPYPHPSNLIHPQHAMQVALLLVSCYLFEMVKLTMIACITDGLQLTECLDGGYVKDVVFYKQQAKLLFKNISKGQHEPSRLSTETGPYRFQVRWF
ncbi:25.3 kDa vesicle transport protein [Triticum urartu]|uniref:25.3 kDa vesicle transport protein n=1 Tax=Triticum urartu TaxID=4572 RepID=M7YZX1_TRIUA|nr:25.3 kDa vesicle transport protein [Triticum urartu]